MEKQIQLEKEAGKIDKTLFRSKITETEEKASPESGTILPADKTFATLESSKLQPPLSYYQREKGYPYTLTYLGIEDIFNNMQTQSEKNRTLSTIDIIESFIKKEIEDKGFIDSISSYKEIINNIENTLGLSDNINPMIKLDKLAEFVRILQGEKTKKKIFINPLKKQIKNIEKQLKKSERTLEERREKILKQRARLKEKHKLQAYRKMLAQKKEAILVRREKINKQAQSLRKLEKQLKK